MELRVSQEGCTSRLMLVLMFRERLEGAKEEVGLSKEALLQEQHLTHQLQCQARSACSDISVHSCAQCCSFTSVGKGPDDLACVADSKVPHESTTPLVMPTAFQHSI